MRARQGVVVAETAPAEPEVLVVAGTERVRVTGRAALIIPQVTLHAEDINRIPLGRIIADFAHVKTKVEVTKSFAAVRILSVCVGA